MLRLRFQSTKMLFFIFFELITFLYIFFFLTVFIKRILIYLYAAKLNINLDINKCLAIKLTKFKPKYDINQYFLIKGDVFQ